MRQVVVHRIYTAGYLELLSFYRRPVIWQPWCCSEDQPGKRKILFGWLVMQCPCPYMAHRLSPNGLERVPRQNVRYDSYPDSWPVRLYVPLVLRIPVFKVNRLCCSCSRLSMVLLGFPFDRSTFLLNRTFLRFLRIGLPLLRISPTKHWVH